MLFCSVVAMSSTPLCAQFWHCDYNLILSFVVPSCFCITSLCCVSLEGDLKYCSAVWAWGSSHPSVFYCEWACYNALSSGLCNMWQYFHNGRKRNSTVQKKFGGHYRVKKRSSRAQPNSHVLLFLYLFIVDVIWDSVFYCLISVPTNVMDTEHKPPFIRTDNVFWQTENIKMDDAKK